MLFGKGLVEIGDEGDEPSAHEGSLSGFFDLFGVDCPRAEDVIRHRGGVVVREQIRVSWCRRCTLEKASVHAVDQVHDELQYHDELCHDRGSELAILPAPVVVLLFLLLDLVSS